MREILESPIPLCGGTDFRAWCIVLQEEGGKCLDLEFQVTGFASATAEQCLSLLERGRANPTWGTVKGIAAALSATIADVAALSLEFEE
jgi:hypothetical protein